MYVHIVSQRRIQRGTVVINEENTSALPNECETRSQRGTSATPFLRKHGHPPRIQRAIHLRLLSHLIELASRKFVLGIALDTMQAHQNLARFSTRPFMSK
jgi:hypothetical protein